MSVLTQTPKHAPTREALRAVAERVLSRTAGSPPIGGNRVRLLRDARENYPAWLEAMERAKHHVHFESYIIHEDEIGRDFAEAMIAKARKGVRVRIVYDWLGALGHASRGFWNRLRASGVEVRCYNPPRLESPLGWLSRDHRKMLAVDGEIGFITGLCVGKMWVGDPAKKIEPWRDTGIEVSGKAVAEMERAFGEIWATLGEPIPEEDFTEGTPDPQGDVNLHVIATLPATAGMLRLDQLVAALARKHLWMTDAYYAGTTSFVQALRAAAKDGVDVRLLVPNSTDIPLVRPFSRAGYRLLLESGVRVFEWNGAMLHAKTAVADGRWSRVGSTNLNIASWFGNCELDAFIVDEPFSRQMEEMYLEDLTNATEIVLDNRHRVRVPRERFHPRSADRKSQGSVGRAAAGAVRVGNAIGAAFTDRRVLEPVEARLTAAAGALLLGLGVLVFFFPGVLLYPVIVVCVWIGAALLFKAARLRLKRPARAADKRAEHKTEPKG